MYWLSGSVEAVTAFASVTTAIALPPLVPRSLHLIRAAKLSERRKAELQTANVALEIEIAERRRAGEQVRKLNEELESRVKQRTADLAAANEWLAEAAAIIEHTTDAVFSKTLTGTVTS